MKTAKLTGPRQFGITDEPMTEYGPGEVLLKVLACGVCSSEMGVWHAGTMHEKVFGHEVVGRVVETGSDVRNFKAGDRVTGMIYGGFREYTSAPEHLLVKVPDNLSDIEAIAEPVSCVYTGLDRVTLDPTKPVVVIGCGYMGLLLIKLLKLRNAGDIIAIDPRPEARENALKHGAREVLAPEDVPDSWKIRDWSELSFERGFPLVCEVTGRQEGINLAGEITALHGELSIVGAHGGGPRIIDLNLWNWKALTVINAHERRDEKHLAAQSKALEALSQGLWETKSLYTHTYSLDEINQAFADQIAKPDGFIKAAILMD